MPWFLIMRDETAFRWRSLWQAVTRVAWPIRSRSISEQSSRRAMPRRSERQPRDRRRAEGPASRTVVNAPGAYSRSTQGNVARGGFDLYASPAISDSPLEVVRPGRAFGEEGNRGVNLAGPRARIEAKTGCRRDAQIDVPRARMEIPIVCRARIALHGDVARTG